MPSIDISKQKLVLTEDDFFQTIIDDHADFDYQDED